jgi:dTMP kinase
VPVLLTREPGGAPGAETLRGLLLSGRHDWSAQAEMLLHFAARAEHVARTIRPALQAGMTVVCDRFYDSTMAYQGYGQGADRAQIAAQIRLLGIVPDLTLVLAVPEDIATARTAARGLAPDRYDRVAAGFRAIAAAEPERCRLIDASDNVDEVSARLPLPPFTGEGRGEGLFGTVQGATPLTPTLSFEGRGRST